MPWTNASIVLNSRDLTSGQYNNCNFNAKNQNIIQGQIHSISVNEVNFPYDIPNVQLNTTDRFDLYAFPGDLPGDPAFSVQIPAGFYSGIELAAAITAEILLQGAAQPTPVIAANLPECTYDIISHRFSFTLAAPVANPLLWGFASSYTYPVALLPAQRNTLGKDIFSIMGYPQSDVPPSVALNAPFISGSAPLAFTQYIDICSPQLCKGQRFRDGSTTNLARRSDVICRLYISNNVSIQEEEGDRPFIINRQFFNARVMKWTTDNSVGTIDIQLYDDVGQPLQTSWIPRPYQITFNCYEKDTDGDDNALTNKLKELIGGAASYM